MIEKRREGGEWPVSAKLQVPAEHILSLMPKIEKVKRISKKLEKGSLPATLPNMLFPSGHLWLFGTFIQQHYKSCSPRKVQLDSVSGSEPMLEETMELRTPEPSWVFISSLLEQRRVTQAVAEVDAKIVSSANLLMVCCASAHLLL